MTGTRTYFFEPFSPPPLSPHSTETYEPHPPTPYSPIYFRALDHTKYDVRNTYSETHPIRRVSTTHSCTVDEVGTPPPLCLFLFEGRHAARLDVCVCVLYGDSDLGENGGCVVESLMWVVERVGKKYDW
jgi:hypothetical protein